MGRISLGIPILAVSLGMGVMFSLPIIAASWSIQEPANDCKPNLTENIKRADRILTGRIEAVLPDRPSLDVWVEPIEWYKGKTADAFIRVLAKAPSTSSTTGKASDLHFASDQPPYLFFLRSVTGGKYRTSRCWGTRVLGTGLTATERTALNVR